MTKLVSSKIFLVIVALIVGGVAGWFAWYLVYPNLHVSGSVVWTGSSVLGTSSSSSKNNSSYITSPTSTPSSSSW